MQGGRTPADARAIEPLLRSLINPRVAASDVRTWAERLARHYPVPHDLVRSGPEVVRSLLRAGPPRPPVLHRQSAIKPSDVPIRSTPVRTGPPQEPTVLSGLSALAGSRPCTIRFKTERLLTGVIDLTLPSDFLPDDPGHEAMYFAWHPYTSEGTRASWLDASTIHGLLDPADWSAPMDYGKYPNWQRGWGRVHRYTMHVLQLIYVYRELMPSYWPTAEAVSGLPMDLACEDMAEIVAKSFTGDSGIFGVGHTQRTDCPSCPGTSDGQLVVTEDSATCSRIYQVYAAWPIGTCIPYRAAWGSDGIQVCPSYMNGMALVADEFLYWANRAYWYAMEGHARDLWAALGFLYQAALCGKVALGATLIPARALVHELVHRYDPDDHRNEHCPYYCCQAGIAGAWWARTRAYLGVPSVDYDDPNNIVDTTFSATIQTYGSSCGNGSLTTTVTFLNPGVSGDSSAYSIAVAFPSNCTPPTADMP